MPNRGRDRSTSRALRMRFGLSFLWILIGSTLLLISSANEGAKAATENPSLSQTEPIGDPNREKAEAGNKQPPAEIEPGRAVSQPAAKKEEQTTSHSAPKWYDFLWQFELPNWIIILGWGIAALIAFCTLGAIKRQADIAAAGVKVAQSAAKAAEESAKAVDAQLHVYRPFLVVRTPVPDSVDAGPQIRRRMPIAARIKVKNYGIGPADIVDYFIECEIFEWNGKDDPRPDYSTKQFYRTIDSIIGANEEREIVKLPFDIGEENFKAMLDETKRLAFHGIINYRGGPEKRYWTRFFWWYLPDGQMVVRANTPELNAHT